MRTYPHNTTAAQRTIVVQARNVNIDSHPQRDWECGLSAVNVVHCQGGILRGDLRDVSYLTTITYGQLLVNQV